MSSDGIVSRLLEARRAFDGYEHQIREGRPWVMVGEDWLTLSDHMPIVLDLCLPDAASTAQELR
jgi:hypothetical protein